MANRRFTTLSEATRAKWRSVPVLSVDRSDCGVEKLNLNGHELWSADRASTSRRLLSLTESSSKHLVVTPNVDHVLQMRTSDALQAAYRESSLRLIDGMPLVMLLRLLGARNARRNTGADLLENLVNDSVGGIQKIVILGGPPGLEAAVQTRVRADYPDSAVSVVPMPFITTVDDAASHEAIALIREADPDYVFLCLGAPKQEHWFLEWRHLLPDAVYIGAGASGEIFAGQVKRAPKLLQTVGCEWMWRLALEPRRLWKRYLRRGPSFILVVLKSVYWKWVR